jgi:hypothetical protein
VSERSDGFLPASAQSEKDVIMFKIAKWIFVAVKGAVSLVLLAADIAKAKNILAASNALEVLSVSAIFI